MSLPKPSTTAADSGVTSGRIVSDYTEALDVIDKNYIGKIDHEKIADSSIQSMLWTLDPHSSFFTRAEFTATVLEPRDLSVLAPECQAILQFCRDWRSVAEVSAVLRLPLGVARILIADMSADGLVRIHQRDDSEGRPDLNLLERVLSGLRKI